MSYKLVVSNESSHEGSTSNDGIVVLTIPRCDIGFGFNVKGQLEEGGPMRAINGELYGPLHQVTALLPDGSAEKSGLKVDDRILEINGTIVEGFKHMSVIEMLRSSSNPLVLTVIRPQHYSRLQNNVNTTTTEVPLIIIPDYQLVEEDNRSYMVFNIYTNNRLTCCRRYNHFEKLYSLLRNRFPRHNFHPLPGKKLFALTDQQLLERRRGLEKFLVSACSITEVNECNIMKQFLVIHGDDDDSPLLVPMKILMPDHSLIEIQVEPEGQTEHVYTKIVNRLGLRTDVLPYFALYEVTPDNFERKLSAEDQPYKIYMKYHPTSLYSGISFKKWIFSLKKEAAICRDPLVLSLIYPQAMEGIKRRDFLMGDRQIEIENLKLSDRRAEVMEIIRHLDGYDQMSFPHCPCDSRKQGHVICSISYQGVQLAACSIDGHLEDNILEFDWIRITSYESQSNSFSFTFSRENKSSRTVTLFTNYSQYMLECFQRVQEERSECD